MVLGEVGNELWIIIKQVCFGLKTRQSKWEAPKRQCVYRENTVQPRSHVFSSLGCGMRVRQQWWECRPQWGSARGLQSCNLTHPAEGGPQESSSLRVLPGVEGDHHRAELWDETGNSSLSSACLFSTRDASRTTGQSKTIRWMNLCRAHSSKLGVVSFLQWELRSPRQGLNCW